MNKYIEAREMMERKSDPETEQELIRKFTEENL